jgi:molybdate transport system substrate-binding protein
MATRHVLAELAADFESRAGIRVSIESIGGVTAIKKIQAGELFDFAVLASDAIDTLQAQRWLSHAARVDVGRSGIAVAVPPGAAHPDLSNEEAVRACVLAARSIAYSTGPSGTHLARLFKRWGVSSIAGPSYLIAPPGVPVASFVASGEAALGFQQLSELVHEEGIELVGDLPHEIQARTIFSAAATTRSPQGSVAAEFLSFLASPQCEGAKRRHGLEPVGAMVSG